MMLYVSKIFEIDRFLTELFQQQTV